MNKKITLLVLSVISNSCLIAQVPVIASANYFQIGHQYPYKYKADSLITQTSVGSSGVNQVWDFSVVNFLSTFLYLDTTLCVVPSTTPYYSLVGISGMDTSNVCLLNKSIDFNRNNDAHYYKLKGANLDKIGNNLDNGVIEQVEYLYTNPKAEYHFPFTYLSSFVDSFPMHYFNYLSGIHFVTGVDSVTVDGYGTLMVDTTIYLNCVRVKTITHSRDTNPVLGLKITNEALYTWFSPMVEGPILTIGVNLDVAAPEYGIYYLPNSYVATGVNHPVPASQINVYPNPVKDAMTIQNSSIRIQSIQLILYNCMGEIVLQKTCSGETNSIDLSDYSSGICFYKAGVDKEILKSGKIIIQ